MQALLPASAWASPWTLKEDRLAVVGSFDYAFADSEFFQEGGARPFPLNGEYAATTFSISARFGVTDRLELEGVLPVKLVTYGADPVILLPAPGGSASADFDFYQNNVIELSQTQRGLADIELAARYRWLLRPFAMATEFRVKAPTGYDDPSGTFGDRPGSAEAFLADVGRFVRPENIQDDVTLGDGQLDFVARMLFGKAFRSGTFVRADIGYKLRLAGAADQFTAEAKVGQLLFRKLLLFAGAQFDYSVEDGRVIGVSVAAIDPELPANEYLGLNNLTLRELRLERDILNLNVGGIVRILEGVEVGASYNRTLWGRNVARIQSFSAFVGVSTDLQLAGDEPL